MSDQYEETFYIVPAYIRKLSGMTLGYMDVYRIIFEFWNKGKECFVGNEEFMRRTGFTEKYISNALTYFESLGELKRVKRGKRRYLIKPEQRVGVEANNKQSVDNSAMVELQFRDGRTTVPPMVELQFQKFSNDTPSQPRQRKAPVSLSALLNKESLNKELNNHDHKILKGKKSEAAWDISADDKHMFERLVGMGVNRHIAFGIVSNHTTATINNIIEIGKSKGVENMGAYINTSIKNLNNTEERANGKAS